MRRPRRAGVIQAPPAMMQSIGGWMSSVYAGHVLALTERRIETLLKRREILEAHQKEITEYIRNLGPLLASLPPEKRVRKRFQLPWQDYVVGIERASEFWQGPDDAPMFYADVAEKRLNVKKYRPESGEETIRWVGRQLAPALRRLDQGLSVIEKGSGKLDRQSEGTLVELNLLRRECLKYTSKAKLYRSKATKEFPVDITGWRYADKSGPLIEAWNKRVQRENDELDARIENAKEGLKAAQNYYDAFEEGDEFLRGGFGEELRALNQEVKHGNAWTTTDVINAWQTEDRPSEVRIWVPGKPGLHQNWKVGTLAEAEKSRQSLLTAADIQKVLDSWWGGSITCTIYFVEHKRTSGAWNGMDGTLGVDVTRTNPKTVKDFRQGLEGILQTLRHELQHSAQDILSRFRSFKNWSDEAGLPSRHIREKGYRPTGIREDYKGKTLVHELRDAEFQTDLADAIEALLPALRKQPKEMRRKLIRHYVGAEGRATSRPFRTWKQKNPGKWREGVSELVAEVQRRGIELPPEPSAARVARRYLIR